MIDGFLSTLSWLTGLVAGIWAFSAWVMVVATLIIHPKINLLPTIIVSGGLSLVMYLMQFDDQLIKILFYTCVTVFSGSLIMLGIVYWKRHG